MVWRIKCFFRGILHNLPAFFFAVAQTSLFAIGQKMFKSVSDGRAGKKWKQGFFFFFLHGISRLPFFRPRARHIGKGRTTRRRSRVWMSGTIDRLACWCWSLVMGFFTFIFSSPFWFVFISTASSLFSLFSHTAIEIKLTTNTTQSSVKLTKSHAGEARIEKHSKNFSSSPFLAQSVWSHKGNWLKCH